MELTVKCEPRVPGSKPNTLRREGRLPAVLYGHKGAESIALTLNAKDAELLVRDASPNNTLIQIDVPDLPWSGKALLREVQTHPWRGYLYHLSFFSIASQDSVQITVPLHFVGESIGVKNGGGALDTVLTELEVACAPDNILEKLDIDVSNLEIGDSIHVSDLSLPKGVTSVGEPDRVVVSVLQTRGTGSGDDSADSGDA